jgi:hypothetical protein
MAHFSIETVLRQMCVRQYCLIMNAVPRVGSGHVKGHDVNRVAPARLMGDNASWTTETQPSINIQETHEMRRVLVVQADSVESTITKQDLNFMHNNCI